MNTAILLIDSDLRFAFWLGQALDRAGHQAFPARDVADGLTLLSQLRLTPRLLILSGAPTGAQALVDRCRHRLKDLKVLCLIDDEDPDVDRSVSFDDERRKPAGRQDVDMAELLTAIEQILASDPETAVDGPLTFARRELISRSPA